MLYILTFLLFRVIPNLEFCVRASSNLYQDTIHHKGIINKKSYNNSNATTKMLNKLYCEIKTKPKRLLF